MIDKQRRWQFVHHFGLPGKNAVLQPPLENFQIRQTMCDTLFRIESQGICLVTPIDAWEQKLGTRSHQVLLQHILDIINLQDQNQNITHYVIRIKKHLHNQIKIIEIERQ